MARVTHIRFRTPEGHQVLVPMAALHEGVVWEGKVPGTVAITGVNEEPIIVRASMRGLAQYVTHFDERRGPGPRIKPLHLADARILSTRREH